MAEINTYPPRGKRRVRHQRLSMRIDMTPMVDLAFLLITFFMLTSVLTKPFVLPIEKYSDDGTSADQRKTIHEKNLITLVLGENNSIYWFAGASDPKIEVTDFSANGIRNILLAKKAEIKDLYVFIKATDQSRYQNLIDILDEMVITQIANYSVMDVTPDDEKLIDALKQLAKNSVR
jgi:biopolymer transport protein ExbD